MSLACLLRGVGRGGLGDRARQGTVDAADEAHDDVDEYDLEREENEVFRHARDEQQAHRLAAGNGQPERVQADVAEHVDAGLCADGAPDGDLARIQPQAPDQAADHCGQRVAGKVRAHGQVAGEIAEHIRAHAGHHADDRAEQHADGCVAQKAEADAQIGRQLDGQAEQVERDVDSDEQGGHGDAARALQLMQRADEDILFFGHRKRHLHNKFICCHSDLGDA